MSRRRAHIRLLSAHPSQEAPPGGIPRRAFLAGAAASVFAAAWIGDEVSARAEAGAAAVGDPSLEPDSPAADRSTLIGVL